MSKSSKALSSASASTNLIQNLDAAAALETAKVTQKQLNLWETWHIVLINIVLIIVGEVIMIVFGAQGKYDEFIKNYNSAMKASQNATMPTFLQSGLNVVLCAQFPWYHNLLLGPYYLAYPISCINAFYSKKTGPCFVAARSDGSTDYTGAAGFYSNIWEAQQEGTSTTGTGQESVTQTLCEVFFHCGNMKSECVPACDGNGDPTDTRIDTINAVLAGTTMSTNASFGFQMVRDKIAKNAAKSAAGSAESAEGLEEVGGEAGGAGVAGGAAAAAVSFAIGFGLSMLQSHYENQDTLKMCKDNMAYTDCYAAPGSKVCGETQPGEPTDEFNNKCLTKDLESGTSCPNMCLDKQFIVPATSSLLCNN